MRGRHGVGGSSPLDECPSRPSRRGGERRRPEYLAVCAYPLLCKRLVTFGHASAALGRRGVFEAVVIVPASGLASLSKRTGAWPVHQAARPHS